MNEVMLTDDNFNAEVLESDIPVMVDFWATWCGPCKVLGPIVSEIADEYNNKLKVGKVDVDANSALAGRYNVMSIPTLKFFKGGKIVAEIIGAAPKSALESQINKIL